MKVLSSRAFLGRLAIPQGLLEDIAILLPHVYQVLEGNELTMTQLLGEIYEAYLGVVYAWLDEKQLLPKTWMDHVSRLFSPMVLPKLHQEIRVLHRLLRYPVQLVNFKVEGVRFEHSAGEAVHSSRRRRGQRGQAPAGATVDALAN